MTTTPSREADDQVVELERRFALRALNADEVRWLLAELRRVRAERDRVAVFAFAEGWNAKATGKDCDAYHHAENAGVRAALEAERRSAIQDAAAADREQQRVSALEGALRLLPRTRQSVSLARPRERLEGIAQVLKARGLV